MFYSFWILVNIVFRVCWIHEAKSFFDSSFWGIWVLVANTRRDWSVAEVVPFLIPRLSQVNNANWYDIIMIIITKKKKRREKITCYNE